MGRVEEYRRVLHETPREDWLAYLLASSGLPGPRGNIEVGRAVAEVGDEALFLALLENDAATAPANDPREFLAFCGCLGLGRLLSEGRPDLLPRLRACANDPRWRMREAVAMALQRLGEVAIEPLLAEMAGWSRGTPLDRRAAIAALCEPALLATPEVVARVLDILDGVTASLEREADRRREDVRALRKGLGYAWSVAIAAWPDGGQPRFERWLASEDADVRWVMRENLKKTRLARKDAAWVERCQARLEESRR